MKDDVLDIIKDLIELVTMTIGLVSAVINYKIIKSKEKKKRKK